jgi:CBS domain containing-hemolysin-like protein
MSGSAIFDEALAVLGVVVLIVLNGLFVAAELALVRIRDTQLGPLAARGNRRAQVAREIVARIDAYIGATQFGITVVSMALGAVVQPVFRRLLEPVYFVANVTSPQAQSTIAILVGFFVNSYLLIVAGELAPKAIAIRKTLATVLVVALPLRWFYRVSYPFTWILNHSARWLLRRLGVEVESAVRGAHSEEELRLLLSSAQSLAGAGPFSRGIVLNALDLRRRVVRDVMRPRQQMSVLDTGASLAECMDQAERTRYSRFPLCEGGDPDKTLGVVHIKDIYAMRFRARSGADLLPAARKLIYVPETARLEKLLQMFLERKLHFAIVVDEYGGTLGMVTLENILEELVGQIQDEFDQEKPLLASTGETSWEASGTLPLHELEELVGGPLPEEGVTTASGWVTQRLGGFPKVGDVLQAGACELRVEEMDGPLVARLRITRRASPPAPLSPVI